MLTNTAGALLLSKKLRSFFTSFFLPAQGGVWQTAVVEPGSSWEKAQKGARQHGPYSFTAATTINTTT
jgi:hypothetical protein